MSERRKAPRSPAWAGAGAALLVLGIAACGGRRGEDWESYDERAATLRELSRANATMAPGAGLAGISTYPVPDLIPFREPAVGVTDSLGYHRFLHRCGACHEAPDPTMHTIAEWPAVLEKMKGNMRKSGLLPLRPEDQQLITQFLIETRGREADTSRGE